MIDLFSILSLWEINSHTYAAWQSGLFQSFSYLFIYYYSQGKSSLWRVQKVSDFLSSLVASFVSLYEKKNEILTGKYSSER